MSYVFEELLTNNYTSHHIPATIQSTISQSRHTSVYSLDMSCSYLNMGGVLREIITPTINVCWTDECLRNDSATVRDFLQSTNVQPPI